MSWREKARPIIARILVQARDEGWEERQIRAALRSAYPFGPRQHHPYKIWLDEIRRQRKGSRPKKERPADPETLDPGQGRLF